MSTDAAYFTPTADGAYMPSRFAQSHWGDDHLNGPAIVGLAAQALEKDCGSPEFMPTRITVDLFRAARNLPTTVEVRVIRDGRRVHNAECEVLQEGRAVARATLVQYRRSSAPPGEEWIAPVNLPEFPTPDEDLVPFIGSDDGGWTRSPEAHQNTSRKRFFHACANIVPGEPVTPFVRAVTIGESTSLVTNLGTDGIGYINGDLTVALSRLPLDDWILVQGDSHWVADGISVGTATLFDRQGAFGSGMVTAVANPSAQIDFRGRPFPRGEVNYE
ncbi:MULTISPECIES: acyl-CoA thioesterase domain-containing protein [unclassified Mycobacterium]|uniref:acyl-CoA thioesterase domain-containing protein n=1 Tax=unclassified Mycobacterium TaxID=2642494 RepID=UPI000800361F|nr:MULTISPECIES: acyl-CoA thioesterase domain-containing protein [unclassified Mycobacterium]OBB48144.1 thioesterase [Mycobacterium sp. 852002-51961_SCH5331710]OBG84199.1 thioesterase [Mycobacterium sp. E136]